MIPTIWIFSTSTVDSMSPSCTPPIKAIVSVASFGEMPSIVRACSRGMTFRDSTMSGDDTSHLTGQVKAVLDFTRPLQKWLVKEAGSLMTHCETGVGSSASIAAAILSQWLGDGREEEVVRYIMRMTPNAVLRRDILSVADDILDRRGDLVGAATRLLGPEVSIA